MATKDLQGGKRAGWDPLRTSQGTCTSNWKRKFREGIRTGPGAAMDGGGFSQESVQLEPIGGRPVVQTEANSLTSRIAPREMRPFVRRGLRTWHRAFQGCWRGEFSGGGESVNFPSVSFICFVNRDITSAYDTGRTAATEGGKCANET